MFKTRIIEPGIQRMVLNINELYPDYEERIRFETRMSEFLTLDLHPEIMDYTGGVLSYLTESVIPKKQDFRPSVLLLFGNPAPSSIRNKCFFAGKKGQKINRFWPKLERAGIISFRGTYEDINKFRTRALFNLDYISQFRIGLEVFHSIPSPASGRKWSGVAGLRRLFGIKALRKIAESERERVENVIRRFAGDSPEGAVIAFQKDAFLGMKNDGGQESLIAEEGKWRVVETKCANSEVRLFRMPPTRYIQAHWYVKFLRRIVESISKD